tara:strand:+ start:620 stop:1582 length:963 start_codon:yes stop_codon:yes gene_type:complete
MSDLAQATVVEQPNRFPSTSFDGLLQGLKSLLKREIHQYPTFSEYNTFRVGVIPSGAAYPVLAVRPTNLAIGPFSSGGQYRATYSTVFEIWTSNDRADNASEQANRLYDDLENFLDRNTSVEGRTYNISFGEVVKDDAVPTQERQFIQSILVPVSFSSKETRPAVKHYSRNELTRHSTLPSAIFDVLKASLSVGTRFNINFFRGSAFPPSPVFPAVTLVETTKNRDRSRASVDTDVRSFASTISCSVTPHEDSVRQNLMLTEDIIDIMFENRNWAGFARNSLPLNVSYGVAQLGGEDSGYLYASEIELAVWASRVTPQYS